jgi:hypothetical protein
MLLEIYRSKNTYCSFVDDHHKAYDIILTNVNEINQKTIVEAKKNRAKQLSHEIYENSKLQDKISSILNSDKQPVIAKGQTAVGLDRRYLILAGVIVGGALFYQFVIKKAK